MLLLIYRLYLFLYKAFTAIGIQRRFAQHLDALEEADRSCQSEAILNGIVGLECYDMGNSRIRTSKIKYYGPYSQLRSQPT